MKPLLFFRIDDFGGSLIFVSPIGDSDDGLCEVDESLTGGGVNVCGCGRTAVSTLTDALHEGNLRQ